MGRVLVTAALGNVGREVVRACLERGLDVRAADVTARAGDSPAAERARLDFLDKATWGPALAGCDALFLLRPPPLGDMSSTLNPFIEHAYAAGIKHIVFLSVSGADKQEWIPHRKVELHLEGTGSAWTVLRCGFFAQNLKDAYRRDIVEEGRLFVPAAAGRVAFIDVRDVGDVAANVFVTPEVFRGQTLTLTGPQAVTFADAARVLSDVLGRPVRYEPASLLGYVWHLKHRRGLPWLQVAVQTFLHARLRKGDAEAVDPSLERCLGRAPRTLGDYVRDSRAVWS